MRTTSRRRAECKAASGTWGHRRVPTLEHLEARLVLSWLSSVESGASTFFRSVQSSIAGVFPNQNMASQFESSLEQGYTQAQNLGPLPNNLSSAGALLTQANQNVTNQYRTNVLSAQLPPTVPTATVQTFKNLGNLLGSAYKNDTSLKLESAAIIGCWGFVGVGALFSAGADLPVGITFCSALSLELGPSMALQYGVDLGVTATRQVVTQSDLSQASQNQLFNYIDLTKSFYDDASTLIGVYSLMPQVDKIASKSVPISQKLVALSGLTADAGGRGLDFLSNWSQISADFVRVRDAATSALVMSAATSLAVQFRLQNFVSAVIQANQAQPLSSDIVAELRSMQLSDPRIQTFLKLDAATSQALNGLLGTSDTAYASLQSDGELLVPQVGDKDS